MREHNRVHGIPEFMPVYPEPNDVRSVVWYRQARIAAEQQIEQLLARLKQAGLEP
jgi:hypothetical protein